MKKILSLAVFALFATAGMAQSSKAQLKMDEGKFTEALPLVEEAITQNGTDVQAAEAKAQEKGKPFDATKFNQKYAGLYNQGATCAAQIFNPELMKAAGNQPLDTAKFVSYLDKMVSYYEKSYDYDHMPDAKGKVKAKYDDSNCRFLEGCLDYYFYSAIFMNQNGNKQAASENFTKHIQLPYCNALASKRDSILTAKKDNYEQAAYFNALLNYEMKNWDEILKTIDAGLKNPEYSHDLYLIKAEATLEATKDTAQYVEVLKDAILNAKDSQSFSDNLMSIYYQKEDIAGAEATVNDMLAKNPDNLTAWYMKGCLYLNLKKDYAGARECFQKVLDQKPDDLLANANMSYAWTNDVATRRMNGEFKYLDKYNGKNITGTTGKQAQYNKEVEKYNQELEEVRKYYSAAKPHMEKVRELAPDRSKVWAPALQQIYSNLGMKDEADQMDAIMANNH